MESVTTQLQSKLSDHIDSLDIAPFIAEEAHYFIQQLNHYKLKKILNQRDVFARYLCALDRENTKMIKKSVCFKNSSV